MQFTAPVTPPAAPSAQPPMTAEDRSPAALLELMRQAVIMIEECGPPGRRYTIRDETDGSVISRWPDLDRAMAEVWRIGPDLAVWD